VWRVVNGAHVFIGQWFSSVVLLFIAHASQSVVSLSTYVDKLSSLFMDIGRSTPRYQEMALLYPRSTKLQAYLNEYFIIVVGLCRYLFKFGQKSTVQQFTSSLSDSHLKAFQADLEKWSNSIKEQVQLSENQESSGFRALARGVFNSAATQQRYATNMRVLDFCSTYDHETSWRQTRKAGNASFHKQHVAYQKWKDSSDSCTLMYTGRLGSGKSVLLANIVDDLHLTIDKTQYPVAYFFCKHDVPESLRARTIIGSLTRQLLCTVPDLSVLAESCRTTLTTGDTGKLLELLLQGFSSNTKAYFILDGLDECDSQEKETLVEAISTAQKRLKIMVCSSFRQEPNNGLHSVTNKLFATRVVPLPDKNPDIESFIAADLKRCLDKNLLTIGDLALEVEIKKALSKGAQGMFLWVALQIQSLCGMKTDRAIREALADLPKDLSKTFARILRKSGISDPPLQAKTLQVVLAAQRPLTTDELREALSVTPGDTNWDPSQMLNNVYSALACCGCILMVDEEELTVRVVHHSVKQYLLNGLGSVNHIGFSFKQARRTLADVVVTYLSYGVFETEISRVVARPMLAQSAPSKIVQATLGSSESTRRHAMRLLRLNRQSAFDMSKTVAESRCSFKPKPEIAFRFYSYTNTYWQDHILYVSGHDDVIFSLSSKLFHSRGLDSKELEYEDWMRLQWAAVNNGNLGLLELLFRAWKFNPNQKDSKGYTPLMMAVEDGRKDTVGILLSVGKVDVNGKCNSGRTPLMMAASMGYTDIVKMLLSIGKAQIDVEDNNGNTSLNRAASTGQKDTVEVLLGAGADVDTKNDFGDTPLMLAADQGHRDIVEALLGAGAGVHAKDATGATPLVLAADQGHRDIVEALLGAGAGVDAKDATGATPLVLAAEHGWRDIVEALLGAGASVDAKNKFGKTPLMLAAERGWRDIVEVLLGAGAGAGIDGNKDTGDTPLMLAADQGHRDIVEALLGAGAGADVDAKKDFFGYTPLMLAARRGSRDIVEVLLGAGADINAKDHIGQTVLMLAADQGHRDMVEALLGAGADINAKDRTGQTVLMLAAERGHRDLVEMLLSAGADVHAKDNTGQTALVHAKKRIRDIRAPKLAPLAPLDDSSKYEDVVRLLET
jgi:ankyrin repeat protein